MLTCHIKECLNNTEPCCSIVEITQKVPINKNKCSYYRDKERKKETIHEAKQKNPVQKV